MFQAIKVPVTRKTLFCEQEQKGTRQSGHQRLCARYAYYDRLSVHLSGTRRTTQKRGGLLACPRGPGVQGQQPVGIGVAGAQAKQDQGEEGDGEEDRQLGNGRGAVIREAPEDEVQQDTPQHAGEGRADVEEGVDGGRLGIGEAVQLQPHGEVAEGEPRRSSENALADDHQEGGQADDGPELGHLLLHDLPHAPLLLPWHICHQQQHEHPHHTAHGGDHRERELPSGHGPDRLWGGWESAVTIHLGPQDQYSSFLGVHFIPVTCWGSILLCGRGSWGAMLVAKAVNAVWPSAPVESRKPKALPRPYTELLSSLRLLGVYRRAYGGL